MVSVTDDFTRADSTGLGAAWTAPYGTTRFGVASNKAVPQTTGVCLNLHATSMGTADHSTQVTYSGGPGTISVVARLATAGASDSATSPYYHLRYNGTDLQLARKASGAGSFTNIGSAFPVTLTAGDIIKIECVGTSIKGYLNGALVCTATDSTIASGNLVGMRSSGSTANIVDDFAAGDVTASTPATVAVPALLLAALLVAPAVTNGAGTPTPATVTVPQLAVPSAATAPDVIAATQVSAGTITLPLTLTAPTVNAAASIPATVTVPPLSALITLVVPAVSGGSAPQTATPYTATVPPLGLPLLLIEPRVTPAPVAIDTPQRLRGRIRPWPTKGRITVEIYQNDLEPPLRAEVADPDGPLDLAAATSVKLVGRRNAAKVIDQALSGAAVTSGGQITYAWQTPDTATAGVLVFTLDITWPDARPQTVLLGAVTVKPDPNP